ncbi:MAG: amidase [Pseudomonadota bacterium]
MRMCNGFILAVSAFLSIWMSAPASAQDWQELTISRIMQAYDSGDMSSEALTRFYLERIRSLDQQTGLNAVVTLNPEALSEAIAADRQRDAGNGNGVLHGIPMLIKDNIDVRGLPTTGGSLALKNNVATTDAFLVAQLRQAGAVILGKTNMAEWAFSPNVTESSIAGITRNPYNLLHTPAGSSGGTGAGVAANFAVAGIGTDTGNSIRGPSSHNALVGIRSTMGLTSRMGVIPLYLRNDIAGPMARSVADAARVLQAIAAADPDDPATRHRPEDIDRNYLQALRTDALEGARIGVMRHYTTQASIDPAIEALFEQALKDMASQGAVLVEDFAVPGFEDLIQDNWCNTFQEDVNQYLSQQTHAFAATTLEQVVASGLFLPSTGGSLENMVDNGRSNEECRDLFENERNVHFRNAVLTAMQDSGVDAVVYPTWSHPPRRIGDTSSPTGDNSQHIAPHTGLPAITVPMGYGPNDLPAGISLLGPLYSEAQLLGYAYSYEQATRHRRAPELPPGADH